MWRRREGVCFVCGKLGHFAPQCKFKVVRNYNPPKPRASLIEGDDIISIVISQVNVVINVNKWVVDSGATRHICANKSLPPTLLWGMEKNKFILVTRELLQFKEREKFFSSSNLGKHWL